MASRAERFDNRVAQVALTLFSALIAVIGLAMLAEAATRWSGACFLVFGVLFGIRALRSSNIVVDHSGVTTRSIVRTHRYAFSELQGVAVAVGRTGLNGFGRQYLILHRSDGGEVAFRELNSSPPEHPGTTSVVQRAAASISARLTAC
jgi:hypothetical protein